MHALNTQTILQFYTGAAVKEEVGGLKSHQFSPPKGALLSNRQSVERDFFKKD